MTKRRDKYYWQLPGRRNIICLNPDSSLQHNLINHRVGKSSLIASMLERKKAGLHGPAFY